MCCRRVNTFIFEKKLYATFSTHNFFLSWRRIHVKWKSTLSMYFTKMFQLSRACNAKARNQYFRQYVHTSLFLSFPVVACASTSSAAWLVPIHLLFFAGYFSHCSKRSARQSVVSFPWSLTHARTRDVFAHGLLKSAYLCISAFFVFSSECDTLINKNVKRRAAIISFRRSYIFNIYIPTSVEDITHSVKKKYPILIKNFSLIRRANTYAV